MTKRMRVIKREPDDADQLYITPPSGFIAARDALVRRLRSAGQETEAAAVQRLRKPTMAIWALNHAARAAPAHVRAFVDALERVKRAQLRQPDDLAAASAAMRMSLARIVADARETVQTTDTAWGPDLLRRVSDTVRGAATEPAQRDRLLKGQLGEELTAPGFDVFGGATPTGARRPLRAVTMPTARAERADLMRRRAAALEREAKEREQEAVAAESEAHRARERLRALEERAKQARRKASTASRTAGNASARTTKS
jgi:hypothetical protein